MSFKNRASTILNGAQDPNVGQKSKFTRERAAY